MRRLVQATTAMAISLHAFSAVANDLKSERPAPIDSWLASLAAKLSKCVGPIGVLGSPTEQTDLPPQGEWIGSIELASSSQWIIQDGFSHTLVVHGPTNRGFLLQTGGITGGQKVLGSFDLSTICKPGFLEAK